MLHQGGWRAVTKSGGYKSGEGAMNYDLDMPPYIQEMADWLDYAGHAAQRRRRRPGPPAAERWCRRASLLKAKLPNSPVLVSCEQNKKEFDLA